jgi:hypothetical protein
MCNSCVCNATTIYYVFQSLPRNYSYYYYYNKSSEVDQMKSTSLSSLLTPPPVFLRIIQ